MPTEVLRKMAELEKLGLTKAQALSLLARSNAVKRANQVQRCLALAWLHKTHNEVCR